MASSSFGITDITGYAQESLDQNTVFLSLFLCSTTIVLQSISIFTGNSSGNARLAIYSDSSGSPGGLLVESSGSVAVPGNTIVTDSSLSGNPTLTAGNYYWLAWQVDNSVINLYSIADSNSHCYINQSFGAFPATIVSPTTYNFMYAIFATGNTIVNSTGSIITPNSNNLAFSFNF